MYDTEGTWHKPEVVPSVAAKIHGVIPCWSAIWPNVFGHYKAKRSWSLSVRQSIVMLVIGFMRQSYLSGMRTMCDL